MISSQTLLLVGTFAFCSIIRGDAHIGSSSTGLRRLQYLRSSTIDGEFIDTESCYDSLLSADVDGDFEIVIDEYLILLQEAGPPGFLSDITDGKDMPDPLQETFYELACLCLAEPGARQNCCNPNRANLPIEGLRNPADMTSEQSSFLFTVCSESRKSAEEFINTPAPSTTPTLSPTDVPSSTPTTNAPTQGPSSSPSMIPTKAPTVSNSLQPTHMPTLYPTHNPSAWPSGSPSFMPTANPTTIEPSLSPSAGTTRNPSESPSLIRSQSPTTGEPSLAPSVGHTQPPTVMPTIELSGLPTVDASDTPSQNPTNVQPSVFPSFIPTRSPTPAPSGSPSELPTAAGTRSPTVSSQPSNSPTDMPSADPSSQPSFRPSEFPTSTPSLSPTDSAEPSFSPTTSPAPSVSEQPSSSPTIGIEEPDATATTTYTIAVLNGKSENIRPSSYIPDLIASMDVVAAEALEVVDFETAGRRRRLEVRLSLPTTIEENGIVELGSCPQGFANSDTDRCEEITASVALLLDDEAPEIVRQLYEAELDRSIERGRLQEVLDQINAACPAIVLTGLDESDDQDREGDDPTALSRGAIAGIAVGSLGFLGIVAAALLISKKRSTKSRNQNALEPAAPIPSGLEWGDDLEDPLRSTSRRKDDQSAAGSSNAVASSNSQIKDGAKVGQQVDPTEEKQISQDDISIDSEGLDSAIGTWSIDSSLLSDEDSESKNRTGTRLVDLGAAPAEPASYHGQAPMYTSREALDAAIISGDWNAVASSAAFLASAVSSGHSVDSRDSSRVSSIQTGDLSWKNKLDSEKAAELDELIQSENWEGVIEAAAKYEQEASPKSQDGTSVFHDQSLSTSIGSETNVSSNNDSQDILAIRNEVEGLVLAVVPEERNNVDEMMIQFRGREEELVETLRLMKERDVSGKAKKASRAQARLEAKRKDPYRSDSIQLTSDDDSDPIFVEMDDDESNLQAFDVSSALNVPPGSQDNPGPNRHLLRTIERESQRNRLFEAIDSGNWEVVGELAATANESDLQIGGISNGEESSIETASVASSTRTLADATADDNMDILEMIDRGDWNSVALAAKRKQRDDDDSQKK